MQTFFRGHDDDVTCLALERAPGAVRRAASGQMGRETKAGMAENGACALVWSVSSKKLLFSCGQGFFERQVQAVEFSPNRRYLIAVGGDNNQTLGVFDLKAAAHERQSGGDDAEVRAPLLCHASMDKLPGALPTVFGLAWRHVEGDSVQFVSLSEGKSLKWWGAEKNETGKELALTQRKKGGGLRDFHEITSMCWSDNDCKHLITGCDLQCSVAIWLGEGGEKPLKVLHMDIMWAGVWSVVMDKNDLICGCGDATVRRLSFVADETWKIESVKDMKLSDTVVDPSGLPVKPHGDEMLWNRVRHVDIAGEGNILCGKEGGTLFHIVGGEKVVPIAGGHAGLVNKVCEFPKAGNEISYATAGNDGLVILWAEENVLPLARIRVGEEAIGVTFSPDGNLMAVGCDRGYVKIFGLGEGKAGVGKMGVGKAGVGKAGGSPVKKATLLSPQFGVERGASPGPGAAGRVDPVTGEVKKGPLKKATQRQMKKTGASSPHKAVPAATSPTKARQKSPSKGVAALGKRGALVPTLLKEHRTCEEAVDCVKFSPSGKWLAAGSHDNFIDVFSMLKREFPVVRRLRGHSSYITGIDWSRDGQCMQSSDGAGELLFWNSENGKQITSNAQAGELMMDGGRSTMDLHDWKCWKDWTIVMGFCVMGVWPDFSDGTDVNGLCVAHGGRFCATSDDFGGVKLFNFPCLVEDAPFHRYGGHSSHVSDVRFVGAERVVSTGSNDRSCFVWKYSDGGDGAKRRGEDEEEEGEGDVGSLIPESQKGLMENFSAMEKKEQEEVERKRLLDPFSYLREKGRAGGGRISEELKGEMAVLSHFMGEMMGGSSGVGGRASGGFDDMLRRSVEMERVLKGGGGGGKEVNGRTGGKEEREESERKMKEERMYSADTCVAEVFSVSDDQLRSCGLFDAEDMARKEKKKVVKEKMKLLEEKRKAAPGAAKSISRK